MSPQLQHPRSETLREPRKTRDKHLSKSAASQQKGGKAASGVYVPRSHSLTNKILQRASTETLARVDLAVRRLQARKEAGVGFDLALVEQVLGAPPHNRTADDCVRLQAELAKARCLERLQLSADAELALLRHAGLEIIRQREQVVVRAGDAGDRFLLILAGALNVEKRGVGILCTLRQGETFGEAALLFDKPRSATVWVEEACHLLVVSKAEYLQRLGPIHALDAQIRLREYRAVPAFDTMTDEELAGVVELTLMRHFAAGEEVLREGAVAGQLIFIVKGFARATRATPEGPAEWAVLGAGSSLDVQAASALAPARYSVEATSALEAMLLPVRASLLGERIVSRLHARELQPPEGDEILRFAEQARDWREYRSQIVSGVVWEMRAARASPAEPGVTFGRFCNLPMRVRADHTGAAPAAGGGQGEATGRGWLIHSLTDGISDSILPAAAKDPWNRSRAPNLTGRTMLGKYLVTPPALEVALSAGQRITDSAGTIKTIAGRLEPCPKHVRLKWLRDSEEEEARRLAEEERRKRSALQGYLHKAHERRMQIADAEAAAPAARAARAAERNALLAVQKGGAAGGVKARRAARAAKENKTRPGGGAGGGAQPVADPAAAAAAAAAGAAGASDGGEAAAAEAAAAGGGEAAAVAGSG